MQFLALLGAALSGAAMTGQAAINGALSRLVGLVATTFVVQAVGLLASGLVLLGARSFRHLAGMGGAPPLLWTGGLLGAFIIFTMAFVMPRLGAGLAVAVVLTAQLLTALVFDHFGLLGMPRAPVNWVRLLGAGLLVAGAWLVKYSTPG
ncbi:MAG: DMT family transporter [Firmicutes bacterium]|nr:DMT family transporter [Bacillota bacterium]